jgi:hypothetical protein
MGPILVSWFVQISKTVKGEIADENKPSDNIND